MHSHTFLIALYPLHENIVFKCSVQPVWVFKSVMYLSFISFFLVVSGFFAVHVAFFTHDNLSSLMHNTLRLSGCDLFCMQRVEVVEVAFKLL